MNQKQREHAVSRIEGILRRRIETLKVVHTTPAKRLSATDRANYLRAGKVKLHPHIKKINAYMNITEAFDFAAHETEEAANPKLPSLCEAERKKARQVIDQIMLGEDSEALKLIASYESGK